VPYHFGQWEYSPVFGWLWLPGGYGYWSPAPVRWVALGNRVGWTPVNPVHLGAGHPVTGVPVIVGTKDLGKGGPNKVLTLEQAGGKLEVLSAPPLSNGKIATPAEMAALQSSGNANAARTSHHRVVERGDARLVVPTALNLVTLRSHTGLDAAQNGFANGAMTQGAIPAQPIAVNGAPPAPKMPHAPPPVRTQTTAAGGRPSGVGTGTRVAGHTAPRSTGTSTSVTSAPHVGKPR
jgi:hypothetical protein